MDWKKVVLVSVFSVLVSFLSGIGIAVAISLLLSMLIKGMDRCVISNLGLALEFAGILIYMAGNLLQPVYSNFQSITQTGVYLLIGGLVLFLIGMLVVIVIKNKLREYIHEV
jgi:hypothetical protein